MSSQPFDMRMMDYEAVRKQKRRKLLLRSLPAVIVVFIVALWFLLPRLLTHQAIIAYKGEQYGVSRGWLTPLTWTSPEPFVIAFNSGTVDGQLRKYERSEQELTRAVALAPTEQKRCMAAQNLVTVLKDHAKSLQAKPKEAASYTTKADTVMKNNKECFKGSAAGGGGGGGSKNDTSKSEAPSKSQQQQLEQKEQEGRERKAKYARDEEYNPDDPSTKPW